jgi:hypothetical protein
MGGGRRGFITAPGFLKNFYFCISLLYGLKAVRNHGSLTPRRSPSGHSLYIIFLASILNFVFGGLEYACLLLLLLMSPIFEGWPITISL